MANGSARETFAPGPFILYRQVMMTDTLHAALAEPTPPPPDHGRSSETITVSADDAVAVDSHVPPWITRAAVSEPHGVVVGDAGFHGPPDEAGMVEVGYTAVPEFRRQGYARAILTALLFRAVAEPGVRTVRASIRFDNNASLVTIAGFGFTRVSEQGKQRDRFTIVFEVPADAIQAEQPYGLGGHGEHLPVRP
ncbi:GNAT family N-acetyltransferase [Streptomyces chryseus]|uniref:GNAT family N-acetyltransferase n=1 Tax=Streptomyces chryseus TaxID=68186 RepID=UPI0019B3C888|nr:GNAT family N-acetyltransferase [Streptomyces chryseus]GGX44639.1 hypothetical protein GCM10010353_69360 [Streptomyces chryseus]